MQVQVEDIGPCKKLLKIEVPAERVDEELDKTYDQLNEATAMPGFRKGHVPRWLMKSRFGKQVDDDTKQTLVTDSFDKAVKEKELRPLGTPAFDEEIKFEAGKPLTFGVTIEVHPEFEIDGYTDLELKKPPTSPTKAEVKKRIDYVRRRYAKLEDVSEGAPQIDDIVVTRLILKEGDEVYRDVPDHRFIAGDHVLIGMTADETTELVTSLGVGDTIEREITIPDAFGDEAKRGAKMTLSLRLDGVRRPAMPEVTAEWAKEVGFDSLDEFNDEIRAAVEREKERDVQDKLEEQMLEQLAKKADFELPEDIVSNMAQGLLIRRSLVLRQRGVAPEEIDKQLDELKKESKKSAQAEAKMFFILDKIAEKERLFVTEEEVEARVELLAANYGRSPDQVLRDLEREDRLGELRSSMREEKVKAFLLEKAAIKETKKSASKAKSKKPGESGE
ncbi:MAG: trigger factor [Planctomycetota bacterium]